MRDTGDAAEGGRENNKSEKDQVRGKFCNCCGLEELEVVKVGRH